MAGTNAYGHGQFRYNIIRIQIINSLNAFKNSHMEHTSPVARLHAGRPWKDRVAAFPEPQVPKNPREGSPKAVTTSGENSGR